MANSIKFYKDDNLPPNQIEKLNEAWNLYISFFRDDFPKWISRNEILNLRSFENMVFVFTVFEGTAFDHLKCKSRIISANCLLMTLKTQRKLPRSLMPIYSLAMTEMNVCCTNIEKDLRQEIYDKVEMMQGNVSKILAETVTHLITTEVGSAKYHAAAGMRIPVMLPDWILELWKRSDTEDIHGSNEEYLHKYRCPIFNKYVICASGFDEETKQKIKYLVESEGGIYNGVLQFATTTHLIINEPKGAKFEHAKEWRINTVKPEWVYESIQAGYCLYEKNYQLRSATQVLTPSDNRVLKSRANIDNSLMNNSPMNNSLINNSLNFNSPKCLLLNEMDINNGFNKHSNPLLNTVYNNNNTNKNNINKPLTNYSDLMKEINSIGKIKLTLFDGIGIYCENFDPLITEKLKKICNSGGAIRFDEYNSDVTHVIVNQLNDALCKSYNELNPEVNIVTIDWLINSCKNNDLEDCKEYVVFKNALNSVKTPKKRSRPEKLTPNVSRLGDSDLNDCLSQYANVGSNIASIFSR